MVGSVCASQARNSSWNTTSSAVSFSCIADVLAARVERELQQLDGVAPRDLGDGVGVEVTELLGRRVPGSRPRPVLVGVVGLESDIVRTNALEQVDAHRVFEEAAEDLPVVIGGRGLGAVALTVAPTTMRQPHVVG